MRDRHRRACRAAIPRPSDLESRAGGPALDRGCLPAWRSEQESYAEFARVADALIEARIERRDVVVALGGGVIGDLAGFCAATLRRGVRLRANPDHAAGAGRFERRRQDGDQFAARQEPRRRLPSALARARGHGRPRTLSEREFRAGYAEVVKYGLHRRPALFRISGSQAARGIRSAAPRAPRRSRRVAPPRRASSSPTRPSKASGRCSISAIRSATRSKGLRATIPRASCTARRSRSAWRSRFACHAISASVPGRTRAGSRRI